MNNYPIHSGLNYVITGLGRSGTTFLAHLFKNSGYDLGEVHPEDIGNDCPVGGGLEYQPFAEINMRLQRFLMRGGEDEGDMGESGPIYAAKRFAHKLNRQWPSVLKDPRFLDTHMIWHHAGFRPKHIFLCIRESKERDASLANLYAHASDTEKRYITMTHNSYYAYFSVFNIMLYCQQYDIPHSVVLYPRIGQDKEYAERILGPFIEHPWETIQKIWDSNLVHYSCSPTL